MIAYLNIVSSLKLRQFKENYIVMNHLKTEEVWLKIDKFERKKISSPGFIMDIHPKLTNIFTLKQEIEYALRDVKTRGATTINEWKKKNDVTSNKENPIPQFFINTTMKKFGDGKKRVEACVFGIECAEEDAGYLKTLLSLGYEQNVISTGTFIPTAYHLITSAELYKAALRGQNKYINNMTAVAIEGIHKDAFWEDIVTQEGKTMKLDHLLRKEIPFIETYEKTSRSETEGRWHIMCKKANVGKVIEFIDQKIPDMF